MREVRYHPDAPSEARRFFTYYSTVSEQLGEEFWTELLAAIETAR